MGRARLGMEGIVNLLGRKGGSREIEPNRRDETTIRRRLLSIFYTGDLIPE